MPGVEIASLSRAEQGALRRLLVAATAAAGRAGSDPQLPALVAAAPLDHLAAAARMHRVDGCVYQSLRNTAGMPAPVLQKLEAGHRHAALRHLVTSRALGEIGQALDGVGAAWVVMKGPALTSLLYRDPGGRTYNDLDLLVAPEAFPEAVRLLEQAGYEHKIQNWALARWFRASEISLVGPSVTVDLHWAVAYASYDRRNFTIDTRAMLGRRRLIDVSGRRVPTFDDVDTLLHLALHAARSNADHLLWFKDIERSIAVDQPDLDELVRRARAFGCAASVGVALRRARMVLGAEIPDDVLRRLLGRSLETVERATTRWSSPVRLHEGDSLAAFVARSMNADLRSSGEELARRLVRTAKERMFGHEGLRRHPAGDPAGETEAEKLRYLEEVASGWHDER